MFLGARALASLLARPRTGWRGWIFGLMGVVLALTFAPSALGMLPPTDRGPLEASPPAATPTDQMLRQAATAADKREQERVSAEAKRHRRNTRLAFRNKSSKEALAVARGHFPDLVEGAPWKAPGASGTSTRRAGTNRPAVVEKYVNPFTAVVETGADPGRAGDQAAPAGDRALVSSTVPLHTEGGAPVDLSLTPGANGFTPVAPLVDVTIPTAIGDGVVLGEQGDVVVNPGVVGNPDGTVVDDKVFYANALLDTDILVKPVPQGVETFHQLRSVAAPEKLSIDLDLPRGAELTLRKPPLGPPSVEIRAGDHVIGSVSAAVAVDAEGTEVPVTYELADDTIWMSVPHRGRDVAYPILVDPTYQTAWWNWRGGYPYAEGWTTFSVDHCNGGMFGYLGGGWYSGLALIVAGPDGRYCGDGWGAFDVAQWARSAPNAAYIYKAQFNNVWHPYRYTCLLRGIYRPDSAGGGPDNPPNQMGRADDYTCNNVGPGAQLERCSSYYCDPAVGTPGNAMLFNLRTAGGWGTRTPGPWAEMGDAQVWMTDRDSPTLLSADLAAGAGWNRGLSSETQTIVPRASDPGLGIRRFQVTVPGHGTIQQQISCTLECSTTRDGSIPFSLGVVPDGQHSVPVYAFDALDKPSGVGYATVRIDRRPPVIGPPTGSLASKHNQAIVADTYSLTVSAADSAQTHPQGAQQSGVAAVYIRLRGPQNQIITTVSGSPSTSFSFDAVTQMRQYGFGTYTFEYWARDNAGNETAVTPIAVSLDPREPGKYFLYKQFGSRNLLNTRTNPAAAQPHADYHFSKVDQYPYSDDPSRPQPAHALAERVTTGAGAGIFSKGPGEYCGAYDQNLNTDDGNDWLNSTGFSLPSQSLRALTQKSDAGHSEVCQAYRNTWGFFVNPTDDTCAPNGRVCGMQHSVSFGPADTIKNGVLAPADWAVHPFPDSFPNSALRIKSTFQVPTFREKPGDSSGYIWAYTCAIFLDETTGLDRTDPGDVYEAPAYVEICLNKWQSRPFGVSGGVNEGTPETNGKHCQGLPGGAGSLDVIWQGFPTQMRAGTFADGTTRAIWTQAPGSPNTVQNGSAATQTFEAYITRDNLKAALRQLQDEEPERCNRWRSPGNNPTDFRLVAIEDGLEAIGPLEFIGYNSSELAVWMTVP